MVASVTPYIVCVFGANGMAGHAVSLYLQEKGYKVIGVTRKKISFCDNFICNIDNKDAISNFLKKNNFDFVINAVGKLNKDCDINKSEAIYANAYFPHLLAKITAQEKTKVIHLSTDCIFSGKRGGYTEKDTPDGESYYDRSKYLGELNDTKNLTFRNSIIGPDINSRGIGLFNWFMKQKEPIYGYTNAYWNGVSTLTLAKAIEMSFYKNITGIYHLVNNAGVSKYTLLNIFNDFFNDSKINIYKDDSVKINKMLRNTRNDFDFIVPDYISIVADMKNWICQHRELYPHYFED